MTQRTRTAELPLVATGNGGYVDHAPPACSSTRGSGAGGWPPLSGGPAASPDGPAGTSVSATAGASVSAMAGASVSAMAGASVSATAGASASATAWLDDLPAAVEVAAYRIAVEAMMNVVRHASATTCRVELRMDPDALDIEVVDDGGGLDPASTGVGLGSMRERAAEVGGDVVIVDADQGGTRVLARLPVDLSILPAPS